VRVHQIGSSLGSGDAITYDVLEIAKRLSRWGLQSHLFAESASNGLQGLVRPDREYAAFMNTPDDLLLYHYSAYTSNIAFYLRSANRKVLIYHGITPPEYFQGYDAHYEAICRLGRLALPLLRGCELALADSETGRAELVRHGFSPEQTAVLPPFVPLEALTQAPENPRLLRRYRDGSANFLFVGRVVPNKALEDVLKVFYCYHRYINPRSRLFLVGSRFLPEYDRRLEAMVEALGLQGRVILTDKVSLGDLKTYYLLASLFLSASLHEGFCVPLVESMHFGVPIVARAAAAVPETLGEAGVLYRGMDYPVVAEMIHLILEDEPLRQRIVQKQRERLQDFASPQVETRLRAMLVQLGVL